VGLLFASPGVPHAEESADVLFQYSTIDALLAGVYDGELTMAELARQGDFGLGTFNGLDGELILLDGIAYRVRSDGAVEPVDADETTPFAAVTNFDADATFDPPRGLDYAELRSWLTERLDEPNHVQALRIEGVFSSLQLRSVPKQAKPYRPLAEVIEEQQIFEERDVSGVLVGFRLPPFLAALNIAGYHFHFLSSDRTRGGHVLDLVTGEVRASVDGMTDFRMSLPETEDFRAADLRGARQKDIEKVEK
jgi:acetolactate decarboxylase